MNHVLNTGDVVDRTTYLPLLGASTRQTMLALGLAVANVVATWPAAAQSRSRPLFEPTDLELEKPWVVELDTQFGMLRSQGPWRAVVPDFEIDCGITERFEIDIDGSYAVEGPDGAAFSLDHSAPDNLWLAAKLLLIDGRDGLGRSSGPAVGAQLGPKLPVATDSRGAGYEALLLVGQSIGGIDFALNAGGLIDPGDQVSSGRPAGLEAGIDLKGNVLRTVAITGEFGGVRYSAGYPGQLHLTAGLAWQADPTLGLSLIGLKGLAHGGDKYGLLMGVAYQFGSTAGK